MPSRNTEVCHAVCSSLDHKKNRSVFSEYALINNLHIWNGILIWCDFVEMTKIAKMISFRPHQSFAYIYIVVSDVCCLFF